MMEPKQDQLMEHDYDGIQEFDNRLPNWWLYTLYGAMIYAVVYWLGYETWELGKEPIAQYDESMVAAAEAQLAAMEGQVLTDETLTLMAEIPASVDAGSTIFQQFCVACHLADGSGSVGPNLTDAYWIHGAKPMDLLKTVTEGVPAKGMAAWADQLGPVRVQQVVAYVLTIQGTNRPGKAPQGELEE